MKTFILFLVALLSAGAIVTGCVNVDAPEKVEINADSGGSRWGRTADKYVSKYAGEENPGRQEDR